MPKQFFFLSGLPRSGSTVLASILSQNPLVYCSPTSVLVGLMNYVNQVWNESDQVKSFNTPGQYESVLGGLAENLYFNIDKPYIIDKNRAWANPLNISLLKKAFGYDPKIICTVRDVVDVLASFIKLIRKNPDEVSFIDRSLRDNNLELNDTNRCAWLMSKEGHVFQSWSVAKWGFQSGYKYIHYVEYEDLIDNPKQELNRIYNFLEIDKVNPDLDNIVNEVQENDNVYYMPGMHTIRNKLAKVGESSINVLGEELYNKYKGGNFWRIVKE